MQISALTISVVLRRGEGGRGQDGGRKRRGGGGGRIVGGGGEMNIFAL